MKGFYKNKIMAVSDLLPYAQNARTHSDEQVRQIAASINEWGADIVREDKSSKQGYDINPVIKVPIKGV